MYEMEGLKCRDSGQNKISREHGQTLLTEFEDTELDPPGCIRAVQEKVVEAVSTRIPNGDHNRRTLAIYVRWTSLSGVESLWTPSRRGAQRLLR